MSKWIDIKSCSEHLLLAGNSISQLPEACPLRKGAIEFYGPIHPDCPLPDWPSVTEQQLLEWAQRLLFFQGGRTGCGTYITLIFDDLKLKLRSIGVIVREGEKDGK